MPLCVLSCDRGGLARCTHHATRRHKLWGVFVHRIVVSEFETAQDEFTVFLWFNVPCHAPAPGKGVQGTRGVHWAAPRGGVQVGGVQLLLPGFCTPRLPGRSTWRPAEYPDNVSLTGVFRSLTQPRTNKPIPKSPMSRDAQCAARNLDFDVGLCVGQTGLMGVH